MSLSGFQRRRRLLAEQQARLQMKEVNAEGEQTSSQSDILTQEEFEAMMKSKVTVMATLRKYDVSFSDRTGSEELRKLLETTLAEKGLLPEVKQNDGQ